jgi:hypothetical protein
VVPVEALAKTVTTQVQQLTNQAVNHTAAQVMETEAEIQFTHHLEPTFGQVAAEEPDSQDVTVQVSFRRVKLHPVDKDVKAQSMVLAIGGPAEAAAVHGMVTVAVTVVKVAPEVQQAEQQVRVDKESTVVVTDRTNQVRRLVLWVVAQAVIQVAAAAVQTNLRLEVVTAARVSL